MHSLWNMQKYLSGGFCEGSIAVPVLTIDNRKVEVDNGATILDAADKLGVEIPTMCFLKGYESHISWEIVALYL